MSPVPLDELIAALSQPGAYPFDVETIEVRQTHVSVLFFAADRVYKVKKPVTFDFLDFGDLERRGFFCREEVRLNQPLAPGVYRGVVPIVRRAGGELVVGRPGQAPVEHAVEMIRLPDDRMLDRLLDRGEVDDAALAAIAQVLVPFHAAAATGPGIDEHGAPQAVTGLIRGNLRHVERAVGRGVLFTDALLHRLVVEARSFIDAHEALLRQRVRAGRILEGHGDLHAGNICLAGPRPIIYDRLEFDLALRCGDTARDLAFLVMDLEARGEHALGASLAAHYARAAGDESFETVMPLYTRHLACVRGLVLALDGQADAALRYFHRAAASLVPAALVLTCGPPGSGKSVLARALARPLGATVIRSDVVRKRLAGLRPTERPAGAAAGDLYSAPMNRRTFETMLDETRAALARGRPVVVDATFARRDTRRPFAALAATTGVPLVVVHLDCPDQLIAERLAARRTDTTEVSDADLDVARAVQATFEPPDELDPSQVLTSDCTTPARDVMRILERLLGTA